MALDSGIETVDDDVEVEEAEEEAEEEVRGIKHSVRSKDGGTVTIGNYSTNKAVKLFCMECICWNGNPKVECTSSLCPLYPFRKYTQMSINSDENKKPVRTMSEERKMMLAKGLKEYRDNKSKKD